MRKSAFELCQSMESVSALERINVYGTLKINKLLINVKWIARNQAQYRLCGRLNEIHTRTHPQCKLIRLISIQSGFFKLPESIFRRKKLNGFNRTRHLLFGCVIAFVHDFFASISIGIAEKITKSLLLLLLLLLFKKSINTSVFKCVHNGISMPKEIRWQITFENMARCFFSHIRIWCSKQRSHMRIRLHKGYFWKCMDYMEIFPFHFEVIHRETATQQLIRTVCSTARNIV